MTYRQFLQKADRLLNSNEITLGEYEKMTAFLDEEVIYLSDFEVDFDAISKAKFFKSKTDLMKFMQIFNNNCNLWRITKTDLAKELNVARSTIYHWYDNPTNNRIVKLISAFTVLKSREFAKDEQLVEWLKELEKRRENER